MENLEFLDQRASVRAFASNNHISKELIEKILLHASYAPSSNNFQPWKVIAITGKQEKNELKKFSFNQKQVSDASAVFLLYGDLSAYDIDKQIIFERQHQIIASKQVANRKLRIESYFAAHPEDKDREGLRLDVGLFSMNLMYVIRAFGYESVPMRGTDFNAIGKYLKVPENWIPILMLPMGKPLANRYKHIRKKVDDFATIR